MNFVEVIIIYGVLKVYGTIFASKKGEIIRVSGNSQTANMYPILYYYNINNKVTYYCNKKRFVEIVKIPGMKKTRMSYCFFSCHCSFACCHVYIPTPTCQQQHRRFCKLLCLIRFPFVVVWFLRTQLSSPTYAKNTLQRAQNSLNLGF